ncbi:hypothetical protein BDV96DRAFT_585419 [Lophiotrema nucula]|uniref:Cora-like Mg2+ transporter protein-domain-containing protein n=1 Tax=Lophiotrema nucula TaxID=690887 RepID=A0A6A5YQJ1_9PLEO|nr:hypothetical protein BDV96DRAFT_585419 [Lophiotrema nucula]
MANANGTTMGVQMQHITPNASSPSPAPSVTPTSTVDDDTGSWLCEKGSDYQQYIAALAGSNPGLRAPDPAHKNNQLTNGNATVVLLEASGTGKPRFKRQQFKHIADLKRHLASTDDKHDKRRIYIMEGLAPDFISVLGGHFWMDPWFFQGQERSCVWSSEFTPASDMLPQPSVLQPEKAFRLQYCELRQFPKTMPNVPFFCWRTNRHVGMTPPRKAEKSTVAILRRKIAFWSRQTEGNKGWDAIILCDPQLGELNNKGSKLEIDNDSFQDGYIDFLPPPTPQQARTKPKHPHHSVLKDLCHYFENHADALKDDEWKKPITASFFLKKIVIGHSMQLIDYIKAMLPSLELHLTTAWVDEQDQWKSLQTISRRCGNYRDDMEDTLLSIGVSLDEPKSTRIRDWRDVDQDFQYIYMRLKVLKNRADTLMSAMTGLASIAGNRQNLEEAKRVKRLNLLALVFIPLAYTSSLFSMQDSYAPGNGQFWVYWVSALLLVLFTFFVTWVLDTALDDAAQWTLRPLRWLKFWGWGRKLEAYVPQPKPKRTKTIYG